MSIRGTKINKASQFISTRSRQPLAPIRTRLTLNFGGCLILIFAEFSDLDAFTYATFDPLLPDLVTCVHLPLQLYYRSFTASLAARNRGERRNSMIFRLPVFTSTDTAIPGVKFTSRGPMLIFF